MRKSLLTERSKAERHLGRLSLLDPTIPISEGVLISVLIIISYISKQFFYTEPSLFQLSYHWLA